MCNPPCRAPKGEGRRQCPPRPPCHSRESGNLCWQATLPCQNNSHLRTPLPYKLLNFWTDCRCAYCIADMSRNALLTKRSKSIFIPVDATPLPFLLPGTRDARHRVLTVSSSLGQGPPGLTQILLPCVRPYSIWLRPYQSGSNFGWSLFFLLILQMCMADLPIARLCRRSRRAIVLLTAGKRGTRPSKVSGSAVGPWPHPSPRVGPFCFPTERGTSSQNCPANLAGQPFRTPPHH